MISANLVLVEIGSLDRIDQRLVEFIVVDTPVWRDGRIQVRYPSKIREKDIVGVTIAIQDLKTVLDTFFPLGDDVR